MGHVRILVTGAAGYVGYAVGRRLIASGHEVVGLVRRAERIPALPAGATPVVADLLDPAAMRQALTGGFDGVCHLAALTRVRESLRRPLDFFTANVHGTVNLLEAVQGQVRLVYGSTAAVYGAPDRQPIRETEPPVPTNAYGASKLAAEQAIRFHASTGAIGATVLRTFNVAGSVDGRGDPDPSRLIPRALRVAAGRLPHMEVNGDGGAVREFVHVDDLAAAYVRALEAVRPGEQRVYNIGSGVGVSVSEVLDVVAEVTGRPVPRVHRPPQPEPPMLVADCSAAQRDLGWRPRRSGLRDVVADAWACL
ncbi:MAG: UDP-glucose 4-epimerase [Streptosporangiaceae bacterium]|jgi:UDP-glucose 4-epimerase|nr:UDP-glucose 4-epimerase [Streptosporangiaceae bacterium]